MLARVYKGFLPAKLAFCGSLVFLYLFFVKAAGGSVWELALVSLCAVGYIYLPGRCAVAVLRLEKELAGFSAPLSIVLGMGFFAGLTCFCVRLQLLWLLRLLPLGLGLAWLMYVGFGARQKRGQQIPAPVRLAALCAGTWSKLKINPALVMLLVFWSVLTLLFGFGVVLPNLHPSVAGPVSLEKDLMWNIGNVEAFTFAFPPQDIRFSQVRLTYHYLTEVVESGLVLVSGVSAYNLVVFAIGPLMLGALLACLFGMAKRFLHSEKKAMFFLLSLFCFSCIGTVYAWQTGLSQFGVLNFHHLLTNINAQGTALICICVWLALLQVLGENGFRVRWVLLGVFLACFGLVAIAKGPAAAIVTCAFVIIMPFMLLRKPHYGKALACLGGVGGIFLLLYFVMFSAGANSSMAQVNVLFTNTQAYTWLAPLYNAVPLHSYFWLGIVLLVDVLCLQPFQFPLYCKSVWRDVRNLPRLPAERLLINAVVVGGLLAFYLFWHANSSQMYFALIAIFAMNLLAADMVSTLRSPWSKGMMLCLGAVAFCTTVGFGANMVQEGTQMLLYRLGVGAQPVAAASYTLPQDEEAMQWLRQNTQPHSAQFATNRIHSVADRADGISNVYSALSGRQAYMEGYSYAVSNMGVSAAVELEKRTTNDALFSAQTPPETVLALCKEKGITHLVFSKQYSGDTSQFSMFFPVFENDGVAIYAVP